MPIEPPSLQQDGTVVVTSRMGRIDSLAGRRMADTGSRSEAEEEGRRGKAAAAQRAADQKAAAAAAAKAQSGQRRAVQPEPAVASEAAGRRPRSARRPRNKPGLLGGMRKQIGNLFGS